MDKTLFGLPSKVVFCNNCVMSNQRPCSYPEFRHTADRQTPTMNIDDSGLCDACAYAAQKKDIDWISREHELQQLLDKHRRNDGKYDCVVPGSGGKDSAYAAHVLKYKYGMHPLTVTWAPTMPTDYGYQNYKNWIEVGGFDNWTFKPNGRVHRLLTQLAVKNLFHPFQTFILGQKNLPIKAALQHEIPLVFYGENEAEYGNPIADNSSSLRDNSFHTMQNLDEIHIGGVSLPALQQDYDLELADLKPYLPAAEEEFKRQMVEVHYLGYYFKWTPQEAYYYAVENTGFKPRPFRTEGTYSKYNSIDDKIDDLHYYTTFIKFGIGRTAYDASQEIRNQHLTREEGVALMKKYDGEFPKRYFEEVLEYVGMDEEEFTALCDRFRSPHLWQKSEGGWELKHQIS